MVKLAKQYYRLADGTKKVNCYHITIAKKIIEKANISEEANLVVKAKNKKIIIEVIKQ